MKKKLILSIVCLLLAIFCVVAFAGCKGKYDVKAIDTDYSANVQSNGGMAVVYGKYLYFINGYAGVDATNEFGKVIRGAIARTELSSEGKPIGTPVIVVPFNVYGTDTSYGGISIYNDYIYYATTNPEKSGAGKPKTAEMLIMRTKVDGTDTQQLLKFSDHTVVWRVKDNNLTYIRNNMVSVVNLSNKSFYSTLLEKGTIATGYKFTDNYLVYLMNNDGDTADTILKAYPLAGGKSVTLLDSAKLRKEGNTTTKYTVAILNILDNSDGLNIFYSKTDDATNKPEEGIYSYNFVSADGYAYDKTKEIRYTSNASTTTNLAYTNFTEIGDYYLSVVANDIVFFNKGKNTLLRNDKDEVIKVAMGGAVTVLKVEDATDGYYLWYQDSNKAIYKFRLFDKDCKYTEDNTVCLFKGTYSSDYTSFEIIDNVVYYMNDKVSKNAYYYVIPAVDTINKDTNLTQGRILGLINDSDKMAAL